MIWDVAWFVVRAIAALWFVVVVVMESVGTISIRARIDDWRAQRAWAHLDDARSVVTYQGGVCPMCDSPTFVVDDGDVAMCLDCRCTGPVQHWVDAGSI